MNTTASMGCAAFEYASNETALANNAQYVMHHAAAFLSLLSLLL